MKGSRHHRSRSSAWSGIRGHSLAALAAVTGFTVACGAILMWQSSTITHNFTQLSQSQAAVTQALMAADRDSYIRSSIFQYLRTQKDVYRIQYEQLGGRFDSGVTNGSQGASRAESLGNLIQAADQMQAVERQAFTLGTTGRTADGLALLDDATYRSWEQYFTGALEQYRLQEQATAELLSTKQVDSWGWHVATAWSMAVVLCLMCLVLTALMVRSLIGPILRLEQAAQALARGDLHVRVPVTGKDELGRLATSFNKMAVVLEEQSMQSQERLAKITKDLGEHDA